ncbi:MAG: hypothetical protein J1F40_03855 [Prevotellaceae bacterium]|nr:hypothetical protein [Prevotellaceae bacterium]
MRKTNYVILALLTALLFSCDGKKPKEAEPVVEIRPLDEIPGIYEMHGTIGDGTSMNVMECINDDGDTIYININAQAIMGGVTVGDEIDIIYNVSKDENVASVAVNMTALQHLWTQRGNDGKRQSLELDSKGRATTYDMTIEYDSWEVKDGLLLLRSPMKPGEEKPAAVDTFEIMRLTPDSLVLINGNMMTEFERYN